MTTPLLAGLAVGAAAYGARAAMGAWHAWKAAGPRMRAFYKGGFQAEMTRREAALILGVRESAPEEKIKEAHRRIMIANHPDAGGSSFVAAKARGGGGGSGRSSGSALGQGRVNEAKDMLLGKKRGGQSIF
eukprot:scaffold7.g3618.t1